MEFKKIITLNKNDAKTKRKAPFVPSTLCRRAARLALL